jgi:ketosteroid isomerase-like protein
MAIAPDRVREIFKGLEMGDGAAFLQHVADDVQWTVLGTHPLAGHYRNKQALIEGTLAKLNPVLTRGVELFIDHLLVDDDHATVELRSYATAKNGMRFDDHSCWVVHFEDGVIDHVRSYLDSALVTRLFQENPIDGRR